MYIGLYVKYLLFLSDFNKTRIAQQIFQKKNVTFYEELREILS